MFDSNVWCLRRIQLVRLEATTFLGTGKRLWPGRNRTGIVRDCEVDFQR